MSTASSAAASLPSPSDHHPPPAPQETSLTSPSANSPLNPRLAALEAKKSALATKLATLQAQRAELIAEAQHKSPSSTSPSPAFTSSAPTTAAATPDAVPDDRNGSLRDHEHAHDHDRDDASTAQHVLAAQNAVQQQISRLQRYNAIKDIGQGLMGLVAERRGERVGRVMAEFGVEAKD